MFNLAANRYYAGDLPGPRLTAPAGRRARPVARHDVEGYGVELHMFLNLIRYVTGDLTPAPTRAAGSPSRPPGRCRWSACTRPSPAGTRTRPSAASLEPPGTATG